MVQVQEMLSSGCKPGGEAPPPLWEWVYLMPMPLAYHPRQAAQGAHTPPRGAGPVVTAAAITQTHPFPGIFSKSMQTLHAHFLVNYQTQETTGAAQPAPKIRTGAAGGTTAVQIWYCSLCTSQMLAVLQQAQLCLLAQVFTTNPRFKGTSDPCSLLCSIFHSASGY